MYYVFSCVINNNNNCGFGSIWLIWSTYSIQFFFNLTTTSVSVYVYVCVHMCKRYVNVHDNTRIGRRSSHKSRDIHDGTEKKQVH